MEALGQTFQQVYISGNARAHLGNHYETDSDRNFRARQLKNILQPSVTALDHFDAISRIKAQESVAGSGDWLLQESPYIQWKDNRPGVLWVQGKPGSGKTFLAHRVIKDLQQSVPERAVAFFFFRAGSAKEQSVLQALRDLSYQLCQQDESYKDHVLAVCHHSDDISTPSSAWRSLFCQPALANALTLDHELILDGLDELSPDERRDLLGLLGDLADNLSCMKLALFGRSDIAEQIHESCPTPLVIHVDGSKTYADISQYVVAAIERSRTLSLLSQDMKQNIVNVLEQNTSGMFLYAKLMVSELAKKRRASAIAQALSVLPPSLTEIVHQIISNISRTISKEDAEDLNHVLAWVLYGKEVLTLDMIDQILQLCSSSGDLVLDMEGRLRTDYSSLFELVGSNNAVSFSHTAIMDYFKTENKTGPDAQSTLSSTIGIGYQDANLRIATICLQVIGSNAADNQSFVSSRLGWYARAHWMVHCAAVAQEPNDHEDTRTFARLLHRVLTDHSVLDRPMSWVEFTRTDNWTLSWAKSAIHLLLYCSRDVRDSSVAWLTSCLNEPLSLFEPALCSAARKWLISSPTDPQYPLSVVLIHAFLERSFGREPGSPSYLQYDQVLAAARWAKFEEDLLWHLKFIQALCEHGLLTRALDYYEEFMDAQVVQTGWAPGFCIIGIVHRLRNDYHAALNAFTTALAKLSGGLLSDDLVCWVEGAASAGIAECSDLLSGTRSQFQDGVDGHARAEVKYKAATFLMKAYKANPDPKDDYLVTQAVIHLADVAWDCQTDMLGSASSAFTNQELPIAGQKCYRAIMDSFHDGHTTRNEHQIFLDSQSRSNFICCLINNASWTSDFLLAAATAAKFCDELPWLLSCYSEALTATRGLPLSTWSRKYLELIRSMARIHSAFQASDELAIELLKTVFHEFSTYTADEEAQFKLCQVLEQLTSSSLRLSLKSAEHRDVLFQVAGQIRAKCPVLNKMGRFIFRQSQVELGLASWQLRNGEVDEAFQTYKLCIRRISRKLLVPQAHAEIRNLPALARILCAAGDDNNAIAACHACKPFVCNLLQPMETSRKQLFTGMRESTVVPEETRLDCQDVDTPEIVVCDGPCRRHFLTLEGMTKCRICLDIDYCSDCFDLLQDGTIPFTDCDKDHEFLFVPRLPPDRIFERGQIPLGHGNMDGRAWLAKLLQRWEILSFND